MTFNLKKEYKILKMSTLITMLLLATILLLAASPINANPTRANYETRNKAYYGDTSITFGFTTPSKCNGNFYLGTPITPDYKATEDEIAKIYLRIEANSKDHVYTLLERLVFTDCLVSVTVDSCQQLINSWTFDGGIPPMKTKLKTCLYTLAEHTVISKFLKDKAEYYYKHQKMSSFRDFTKEDYSAADYEITKMKAKLENGEYFLTESKAISMYLENRAKYMEGQPISSFNDLQETDCIATDDQIKDIRYNMRKGRYSSPECAAISKYITITVQYNNRRAE
ncbi:uncharacterized protein LOC122851806 [Aphidius gifuensis]|uniref:uncharacterized protein LOC122851806 n=1 Tax=Aphidius gifuensis TaxID=684658 RepID=UPI001CDBB9F9|nr:uncharacterized protein LOC122851806 [Aphidius gifuensis]